MSKRITIALNSISIEKAIDEIKAYKESLVWKCTELVNELQKVGIQVAKDNSGEYGEKILFERTAIGQSGDRAYGSILASDAETIVRRWRYKGGWKEAEVSPLLMAEFGSGWLAEVLDDVPGVGQGTFPGQKHAFDADGWRWTGEDNAAHHSRGEAPTHPMHNAEIEMRQQIAEIAKRIFSDGK